MYQAIKYINTRINACFNHLINIIIVMVLLGFFFYCRADGIETYIVGFYIKFNAYKVIIRAKLREWLQFFSIIILTLFISLSMNFICIFSFPIIQCFSCIVQEIFFLDLSWIFYFCFLLFGSLSLSLCIIFISWIILLNKIMYKITEIMVQSYYSAFCLSFSNVNK